MSDSQGIWHPDSIRKQRKEDSDYDPQDDDDDESLPPIYEDSLEIEDDVVRTLIPEKEPKDLGLNFYDVGQGNCTVITIDNNVWIIDAGSNKISSRPLNLNPQIKKADDRISLGYNIASDILKKIPSLERLHVVISHFDGDHYNLIQYILDYIITEQGFFIKGNIVFFFFIFFFLLFFLFLSWLVLSAGRKSCLQ